MADADESRTIGGSRSGAVLLFYVLALAVAVVVQATKLVAVHTLVEGTETRILGPIMSFSIHYNTGAAWGVLAAHTRWLTAVAAVLALLLALYGLRSARLPRLLSTGLALLLGGAVGNLIDRVRREAVVDFIDFHVWPVFNVSDIAIVVGAILVAYRVAWHGGAVEHHRTAEKTECDQC